MSYYSQERHGPFEIFSLGDVLLQGGSTLKAAHIAYRTFGRLNSAKSNAILFTTWFSGTGKILEQVYVGESHALDPSKYFVIIVDQLGDGLSTSPSNAVAKQRAARFPFISIADDVDAQRRLVTEKFGIETLALVLGASMGAQQTFEWAVRYPQMVRRAAPIAGTARAEPHNRLYTELLIQAITSDPGWKNGAYENIQEVRAGLARHAHLWALMGWSSSFYKKDRIRAFGYETMESFVSKFMVSYFEEMDPNNLIVMARKWQSGDVSRNTGGDYQAALKRIEAEVRVIGLEGDMFFPVQDCADDAALIRRAELRVATGLHGHMGLFGADPEFMPQIDQYLNELLSIAT